jgi:hypothetical protein
MTKTRCTCVVSCFDFQDRARRKKYDCQRKDRSQESSEKRLDICVLECRVKLCMNEECVTILATHLCW